MGAIADAALSAWLCGHISWSLSEQLMQLSNQQVSSARYHHSIIVNQSGDLMETGLGERFQSARGIVRRVLPRVDCHSIGIKAS